MDIGTYVLYDTVYRSPRVGGGGEGGKAMGQSKEGG